MKKIFLFIILLSVYSFGQENRTVRMNNLTDSLNTIRASIALKLNASDTTSLSNRINLKLTASDTTSLSNRINLKASLVITDSLADDISNIADSNFVLTSEMISGTDSIHYGQDSIVVTHGVGSTPRFISIQLVSDGFGFQTWVSGINSLTFYVRRSDTGLKTITSSIQFKWMAYR